GGRLQHVGVRVVLDPEAAAAPVRRAGVDGQRRGQQVGVQRRRDGVLEVDALVERLLFELRQDVGGPAPAGGEDRLEDGGVGPVELAGRGRGGGLRRRRGRR